MSLTLDILKAKFPEVHASYLLQEQLPEARYNEKLQFWRENGISCFERWVVPYFLEREKEKKRCCLRLNYPPDGKCDQCTAGKCRYDRACFMCGKEGHGAFQSYPGGKMKGELKCATHRNFLAQLADIRKQYSMEEDDIRALFTPPVAKASSSLAPPTAPAPAKTLGKGESKEAKAAAKGTGKAEDKAPAVVPVSAPAVAGAGVGAGGGKKTAAAVVNGARPKATVPAEKAAADYMGISAWKDKGSPTTVAAAAASARASPMPAAHSNGHRRPDAAAIGDDDEYDDDDADDDDDDAGMPAPAPRSRGPPASPLRKGPSAALPTTPLAAAVAAPPGSPPALFLGDKPVHASASGSSRSSSSSSLVSRRGEAGLTIDPALAAAPSSASLLSPLGPAHTYELFESNDYGPASILNFGMTRIIKASAGGGGSGELNGGMTAYRGQLTNATVTEEVAVTVWIRPSPGSLEHIDALALNRELKTLRMLAAAGAQVARVLHKEVLDIAYPPGPGGTDISVIVSEHSEAGTLDTYLSSYLMVQPAGFSRADLQVAAAHLVETLLRCHNHGVCHRDLRPSNVLVCRSERYHARQIAGGFVLKLTDFRLSALAGKGHDGEVTDCFAAPEVDAITRATGAGYGASADVWALGVLLYFTATGGRLPFDSHRQAQELALLSAPGAEDAMKDTRLACLRRHGLAEAHPELYDLVERMLRPAPQRIALARARCHPFLWTLHERRTLLIDLANVTSGALGGVPEAAESFSSGLDRFCPMYVFSAPSDGPGGASVPSWAAQMAPELLAQVQPQSLALEFWWSGKALLQAARNALVYPEPLQRAAAALSPGQQLSPQQAVARYLHQLLEKDFPRLLVLVFELGALYGSWVWDGDDVAFAWNAQMHTATPTVPPAHSQAQAQPLPLPHNHHHISHHRPTQL